MEYYVTQYFLPNTLSNNTLYLTQLVCLPCFYPRPTTATNAILGPSAEYNNNYYDYDDANNEAEAMKADVIVGKPIPQSSGGTTSQGYI